MADSITNGLKNLRTPRDLYNSLYILIIRKKKAKEKISAMQYNQKIKLTEKVQNIERPRKASITAQCLAVRLNKFNLSSQIFL